MKRKIIYLLFEWPIPLLSRRSGKKFKPALGLNKKPSEPFPQTFILESFFLQELITALTPGVDEELRFLTGPKLGPIRIICRMAAPMLLHKQSPVYAAATAKAVASVLIPIIEQGAELHIVAHSHPGRGAGATTPSGIDIQCLGKLQQNGSLAIGCIVTRDGCVCFFSALTRFHVIVLGTVVKELSQNVFNITRQNYH